jgi:hypothetical protein
MPYESLLSSSAHMDVAINGCVGRLDRHVGRGERDALEWEGLVGFLED